MKSGNHSNALLVELLIVIMFFMLAATVLVQVFSAAEEQSRDSGLMVRLLNQAQNLADQLYDEADPKAFLTGQGFTANGNVWEKADTSDQLTARVTVTEQAAGAGIMRYYNVSYLAQDETLISLDNAKYLEVSP